MHKCANCPHMRIRQEVSGRRYAMCSRFNDKEKALLAFLVEECPFAKKDSLANGYQKMMQDAMYLASAGMVRSDSVISLIETILEIRKQERKKPKKPDLPIWKETDYFWIVVSHQVGPLKLLEIVLKEGI